MRALREYSLQDWARLRPITHAYKTAIYRAETAHYVRRKVEASEALVARLRARNRPTLVVTIAYEAPWVIELQVAAAQRYFKDVEFLVCDNSKRDENAAKIAEICRDAQIEYLRLPSNPKMAGSRSHALAVNWAYRNLVCAAKPACFAFLDHDLIPTAAVSFPDLVEHQPFYGRLRRVDNLWFLWAGFCVFDERYCKAPLLDFSQDWFNGLDTGGANYRRVYRHFDRDTLCFADHVFQDVADPLTGQKVLVDLVDGWIHFNNVGGWNEEKLLEPDLLKRILTSLTSK